MTEDGRTQKIGPAVSLKRSAPGFIGLIIICLFCQCRAADGLREEFVSPPGLHRSVHAATLVALPDGQMLCCWYAGSRERGRDAQIYCSRQARGATAWSAPEVAVARQEKAVNGWLSNVTLGNPAILLDRDGLLWLFYSATTVFDGWSAAHVEYKTSDDSGLTWSQGRRLTDGFGRMTRCRPLELPDGRLLLPLYREVFSQQSMLCTLRTRARRVVARSCRPIPGSHLQPALVRFNGSLWAYMRVEPGDPVLRSEYQPDRNAWKPPSPINVPNPGSSLDITRVEGGLLLACNPDPKRRTPLSLMFSRDGIRFSAVAEIESGQYEGSYPTLVRDSLGLYHLVYTSRKEPAIKHVAFSQKWLDERVR